MAWPSNSRDLDDEVDKLFAGRLLVPLDEAWKALGIKKSHGHNLINRGVLDRRYIGGRATITVPSIKRVLKDGVPASPPVPLRRPE